MGFTACSKLEVRDTLKPLGPCCCCWTCEGSWAMPANDRLLPLPSCACTDWGDTTWSLAIDSELLRIDRSDTSGDATAMRGDSLAGGTAGGCGTCDRNDGKALKLEAGLGVLWRECSRSVPEKVRSEGLMGGGGVAEES